MTSDGQVWIDKQAVDVRSVRAHVERMRVDQPDGAVVVQADRDARTGLVVQVMDQARQAGVHDVALAASTDAQ
ncbi:Biopolymer transport protein ExbD/TolR [compost metagenome]